MDKERLLRAAAAYVEKGWPVFTVSPDKIPFANCAECSGTMHDPQDCDHPVCHAFYAATLDMERVRWLVERVDGRCALAVRTGALSRLVVLDAEGTDKTGFGMTGVEVLDDLEAYVPGACLAQTLRAHTSGGGVHLLYQIPEGTTIGSKNRVLPNVDIKASGGYVVVPPAAGRRWDNWGHPTVEPSPELLAWMIKAVGRSRGRGSGRGRGRGSGSGNGGFAALLAEGNGVVPAGIRYEYTRDLVYKLRKQGVSRQDAEKICRAAWERYQQPPPGSRVAGGVWYMPWRQVEYELERAWIRVEPEQGPTFAQRAWALRNGGRGQA